VDHCQDKHLDRAAAVVECERKAENALAEANSCYISRKGEERNLFHFAKLSVENDMMSSVSPQNLAVHRNRLH
jgi:hypothetical protein